MSQRLGLKAEAKKTQLPELGALVLRPRGDFELLAPGGPTNDLAAWLADLAKTPGVRYVEIDSPIEAAESPRDPEYPRQWWLQTLGEERSGAMRPKKPKT